MFSPKLDTELTYLPGVGPQRAKTLKKLYGLSDYKDLLFYFPFRYEDKSSIRTINSLNPDTKKALVKGIITGINDVGSGRKRRLVMEISDQTGSMELLWFKGVNWISKNYEIGQVIQAYGRVTFFNGSFSISHPEISRNDLKNKGDTLTPIYSTSEVSKKMGMDSNFFAAITKSVIDSLQPSDIQEILPDHVTQKYKLPSRYLALQWIHHPPSHEHQHHALRRLKFEELFLMQMDMVKMKMTENKTPGLVFPRVGENFNRFYKEYLPFELTGAQKRVMKEIREDLKDGFQMNRLIQGDVGSGKTIIALLTMLLAIDNGAQTCLMAPTEILAQQHYISFKEYLEPLGIEVALLTGSTKAKDKKQMLSRLKSHELQIIIGTHALIEPTVEFDNLGLVIIDEQHKFGVAQRAKLKNKNDVAPHIMVMTATPIPRSLALTTYGHMDVSSIDELPEGRKPIKTNHVFSNRRMEVMNFVSSEIKKGHQAYIVYPLIEESEKLDYESLERGYEEVKSHFPELQDEISLVHGRQDVALREANMKRFVDGHTKILVATTVIEVGVNIPNASVMVIESSERFGLSQLHQLRGRVGRGADQAYCILMSSYKLSEDAKKRLAIMVETNDGFRIAEQDMILRGPGNMVGTQQSGALEFRLIDLETDRAILEEARKTAINILEEDSNLMLEKNQVLKKYLVQSRSQDWSEVL